MPNQPDLFSSFMPVMLPKKASDRLVPFGKYKDQPFEVLLTDADYSRWLLSAQRTKLEQHFPALLAFLIGRYANPENTPAHNRLQNRFLNKNFAIQFALVAKSDITNELRHHATIDIADIWTTRVHRTLAAEVNRVANRRRWEPESQLPSMKTQFLEQAQTLRFEPVSGVVSKGVWQDYVSVYALEFEDKGADVTFTVYWSGSVRAGPEEDGVVVGSIGSGSRTFRIEVKPVVGDDYPAILRAMKAVKCNYLLVGEYCGAGASWEDVVKVFSLSGMTAVLLADVEGQAVLPALPVIETSSEQARNIVDREFGIIEQNKNK